MTVPVPLTDIEAAHHQPEFGDWDTDDRFCHGCSERWPCPTTALCEALRIAVAAPAGLCCPKCGWMWGESRDEYNGCEQCDENAKHLAAVRELVDLGEKP